MIVLKRTTSDNPEFEKLVVQLDVYLAILNGDDHEFYTQFNKTNLLKNAVIAYENDAVVGIGAYKEYNAETVEIKRMYTLPEHRGKGIASKIVNELENWAKKEGYRSCILETSCRLENAIALYKKAGFEIIPNYGQYIGVQSSVCMKKIADI